MQVLVSKNGKFINATDLTTIKYIRKVFIDYKESKSC